MWYIVKCPELKCSRYMITRAGTKRKKCPYCNRSFKVDDNFIKRFESQVEARNWIKALNKRI